MFPTGKLEILVDGNLVSRILAFCNYLLLLVAHHKHLPR